MKVENMTDCDDVTPGSTSTLMQCGTGYARRFKFAGHAAYDGFTQLKSKEGMVAVQRAAKMILKVDDDSYGNDKYVPSKRITRKGLLRNHRHIPIKTKNGLVQRSKKIGVYSTPSPDVVNRSSPLSDTAAEALVNMTMETSPEPVSYNPEDLMEKCTVSGSPSCPMLRDALSQLSAEVRWARDQAAAALAKTEEDCKRLSEDYERQTQEWEQQLEDNNMKLSESTGQLNEAEENLRQKVIEANELLKQLGEHRKECVKKIKEGAETICGIKSIRQELYQMQTYNPFIEDCEVGEWQPGECSVECGGGERTLTREVVTPASNGGAECPIMIEKEPCNMQPCPIDCVVDMWSEFGACSKDCGGGIQTRVRRAITAVSHAATSRRRPSATWTPAICPASSKRNGRNGAPVRRSAIGASPPRRRVLQRRVVPRVTVRSGMTKHVCRQPTAIPWSVRRTSSARHRLTCWCCWTDRVPSTGMGRASRMSANSRCNCST